MRKNFIPALAVLAIVSAVPSMPAAVSAAYQPTTIAADAGPVTEGQEPPQLQKQCRVVKPIRTEYKDGRGQRYNEPGSGRAEVLVYDDNGTRWTETVPPSGFRPVEATDQELVEFGIPARPVVEPGATAARDAWERAYSNWRGVERSQRQTCVNESVRFAETKSRNWSGALNRGYTDFRRVYGTMRFPTFINPCGNYDQDVTGIWTGLGGASSANDLLQAGAYSSTTQLNGGTGFWEAINGSVDSGARTMALTIRAADLLRPDVYYNSANGTVTFALQNLTTGYSAASVTASSISNYPVSAFYDGTTGEWIHERAYNTQTNSLYNLRQFSSVGVSDAYVTRAGQAATPIGGYIYDTITMSRGTSNDVNLARVDNGLSSVHSFTNYWKSCN